MGIQFTNKDHSTLKKRDFFLNHFYGIIITIALRKSVYLWELCLTLAIWPMGILFPFAASVFVAYSVKS